MCKRAYALRAGSLAESMGLPFVILFCKSSLGLQKKRHTECGMYVFRGRSLLFFCSNGFLTPFYVHFWSHRLLKHIISEPRNRGALWLALWTLSLKPLPFWECPAPISSMVGMAWVYRGHPSPTVLYICFDNCIVDTLYVLCNKNEPPKRFR